MTSPLQKYPSRRGWGVAVTSGTGAVEVTIYGPFGGWYSGDWMTPDQADALALGLIRQAQLARERSQKLARRAKAAA